MTRTECIYYAYRIIASGEKHLLEELLENYSFRELFLEEDTDLWIPKLAAEYNHLDILKWYFAQAHEVYHPGAPEHISTEKKLQSLTERCLLETSSRGYIDCTNWIIFESRISIDYRECEEWDALYGFEDWPESCREILLYAKELQNEYGDHWLDAHDAKKQIDSNQKTTRI